MDRLRLAFLDASHGSPHAERNFRRELDADLAEFDVTCCETPATFDFDGFVVSGSRSSVYEEADWQAPLREWVSGALDRGLPALGVCWGHQFLADVLGGSVEDMGEYEIGYREVERRGDSELLAGVGDSFTVFTTHSDTVSELPPGAELLAENDYGVHGFRKGDAFGVQFHPEYDPETARYVTEGKDGQLSEAEMERALSGITERNYAAAFEAKQLFANFTEFVRRERRTPARA
jgi:GMP synthase (glutamine-hydrolysing)